MFLARKHSRLTFYVFICCLVALVIWLNSGTLNPYAAYLATPAQINVDGCTYLANFDYVHDQAVISFLSGASRETWEFSVSLRRVLFPLLAFIPVKFMGYYYGSIATSLVLHLGAIVIFGNYIKEYLGNSAERIALLLAATFPLIAYYGASTMLHAIYFPICIVSPFLIKRILESATWRRQVGYSTLLGVLFLGYDLFPIFGVACLISMLIKKAKLIEIARVVFLVLLPTLLWLGALTLIFHVPPLNANTAGYGEIINAYLHPQHIGEWIILVTDIPTILGQVYFYSGFLFLPILVAITFTLFPIATEKIKDQAFEVGLASALLALFLFNHLAPPYEGWQYRGAWISRLYAPGFVAMIVYVSRRWQYHKNSQLSLSKQNRIKIFQFCIVVTILLNMSISLGGIIKNHPLTDKMWLQFYGGTDVPRLYEYNLTRFGRHPIGLC